MKPIATKSEKNVGFFFFLPYVPINLNMASISDTGNVQPVFNLDPCVIKQLWCYVVCSNVNSFL